MVIFIKICTTVTGRSNVWISETAMTTIFCYTVKIQFLYHYEGALWSKVKQHDLLQHLWNLFSCYHMDFPFYNTRSRSTWKQNHKLRNSTKKLMCLVCVWSIGFYVNIPVHSFTFTMVCDTIMTDDVMFIKYDKIIDCTDKSITVLFLDIWAHLFIYICYRR